jgi:hypothetical protein
MSKSEVHFTRLGSEWRMVCCGVVGAFEFVCIYKIKTKDAKLVCLSCAEKQQSRLRCGRARRAQAARRGRIRRDSPFIFPFTARKLAWKDGQ